MRHCRGPAGAAAAAAGALLLLLLCAALPSARAVTYYVNSATGNDKNLGTSSTQSWKTIGKVNTVGASTSGFRPGDTILLSGTFTQQLYLQLDKSYGSAALPVTIASADPASPATIYPSVSDHAISIYSVSTAPAKGLGFRILNLILKGRGGLNSKGQTTSGISLWHDNSVAVDTFIISGVTVTGFSNAGIYTARSSKSTPFIKGVVVQDTVAYANPGVGGLTKPSGSGICLSGVQGALIQNCTAYGNGALNTNAAGPVGIWAYDSDGVQIRYCSSHDNLSKKGDGGGYDFDGGTTNSVIEYSVSYNNWGYGYLFCAYSGYSTRNVTVRHSSSTNDAWGTRVSSGLQVYPSTADSSIAMGYFYNNTVNINTTCTQFWTNNWVFPTALGVYGGGAGGAPGTSSDINWFNNTLTCTNLVDTTANLTCKSTATPFCT